MSARRTLSGLVAGSNRDSLRVKTILTGVHKIDMSSRAYIPVTAENGIFEATTSNVDLCIAENVEEDLQDCGNVLIFVFSVQDRAYFYRIERIWGRAKPTAIENCTAVVLAGCTDLAGVGAVNEYEIETLMKQFTKSKIKCKYTTFSIADHESCAKIFELAARLAINTGKGTGSALLGAVQQIGKGIRAVLSRISAPKELPDSDTDTEDEDSLPLTTRTRRRLANRMTSQSFRIVLPASPLRVNQNATPSPQGSPRLRLPSGAISRQITLPPAQAIPPAQATPPPEINIRAEPVPVAAPHSLILVDSTTMEPIFADPTQIDGFDVLRLSRADRDRAMPVKRKLPTPPISSIHPGVRVVSNLRQIEESIRRMQNQDGHGIFATTDTIECSVCYTTDIDIALIPCGHAVCCSQCFCLLPKPKCPACRSWVHEVVIGEFVGKLVKDQQAAEQEPIFNPRLDEDDDVDAVDESKINRRFSRVGLVAAPSLPDLAALSVPQLSAQMRARSTPSINIITEPTPAFAVPRASINPVDERQLQQTRIAVPIQEQSPNSASSRINADIEATEAVPRRDGHLLSPAVRQIRTLSDSFASTSASAATTSASTTTSSALNVADSMETAPLVPPKSSVPRANSAPSADISANVNQLRAAFQAQAAQRAINLGDAPIPSRAQRSKDLEIKSSSSKP